MIADVAPGRFLQEEGGRGDVKFFVEASLWPVKKRPDIPSDSRKKGMWARSERLFREGGKCLLL